MFDAKQARRVTIIADASLKTVILDKVTALGAKGYNFSFCNGKGSHAITGEIYDSDMLVRIEIVTNDKVAADILDFIHAAQFAQLSQYALTTFSDVVDVDQRDKAFE